MFTAFSYHCFTKDCDQVFQLQWNEWKKAAKRAKESVAFPSWWQKHFAIWTKASGNPAGRRCTIWSTSHLGTALYVPSLDSFVSWRIFLWICECWLFWDHVFVMRMMLMQLWNFSPRVRLRICREWVSGTVPRWPVSAAFSRMFAASAASQRSWLLPVSPVRASHMLPGGVSFSGGLQRWRVGADASYRFWN